jgi:glutathione S-transferase
MQYLADRYDPEYKISFPRGSREYYEVNNWLFFMNAGVGPMQGQASKCMHTLEDLWQMFVREGRQPADESIHCPTSPPTQVPFETHLF